MRQTDRWAFLDEESDIDEEGDEARQEASELHEQANGLTHFAESMPEGRPQFEKFREAVSMYRRASTCITKNAAGRKLAKRDYDLVLQCRLNAACVSLKLGDEKSIEESCKSVADLDASNPHMALFQARLATLQCKRELAAEWEERARRWAKERGEEHLIQQASDVQPKESAQDVRPAAPAAKVATPSVARWVQEGVALIKQQRAAEAEDVLKRAIHATDQPEHGGPIERIAARAPRALAFNALEALSEVYASLGRWKEAVSCGQRAVELLDEGEFEKPFSTPELYRREGHLCLSMGHVTLASGGDPLPTWRRATNALRQHGDDLSTEGFVLSKIGLRLASRNHFTPGAAADMDEVMEALTCLEHAGDRFRRARVRLAKDPEGLKQPAVKSKSSELARQELEVGATLARLLHELGEREAAEKVLDSSAGLLELAPANGADVHPELAESWADHCGVWALTADKVRRLEETERAILIQCRLLREAGSRELEMEALRALAVVHRQRRNEQGVEEALSLEALAPEDKRERIVQVTRNRLHQVGPAIEPDVPAEDVPVPAAVKTKCLQRSYVLSALSGVVLAILTGAWLQRDALLVQFGVL
jgi:tetratricopeptide (TPR) repeat protein